jgi:hypothetical protein
VALAVVAVPTPGAARTESSERGAQDYMAIARKGLADSRSHWWNPRARWYRDRLRGGQDDVATLWNVVHVFETMSALAVADPSGPNRRAVRGFGVAMERYWSRNVLPHGAYTASLAAPGGNGVNYAYFDDNGWLGLAFMDAYRATRDGRFIGDAARALRFIDERGWAGKRGVLWNTWDTETSMASYASATALAAELYRYTNSSKYRRTARRYVAWGDRQARRKGLYGTRRHPPVSYVEGAMIGAHLALCRKHVKRSCRAARSVARAAYRRFGKRRRYHAPQFDTIMFRYLLRLARDDRQPRWYRWAQAAAADAFRKGRDQNGLFLRFWDGSPMMAHGGGVGPFAYGRLCTHAGTVSLFAWLAAIPHP